MILVIVVFLAIMLGSPSDKYEPALSRKKEKKLPKNGEYEELIARYVKGKE